MTFLGADTGALRAHATETGTQARRIESLVSGLVDAVCGVQWEGEDAEEFRRRCTGVRLNGTTIAAMLRAYGASLSAQADEQDLASGTGGSEAAGPADGRLPESLVDGMAGELFGGLSASGRASSGAVFGEGVGMTSSLTASTHDAGGPGGSGTPPLDDDDFHVATPEGDSAVKGEVHAGDGSIEATQDSRKLTLSEDLLEVEINGAADVEASLTRSGSVEQIVNEDGSLTFVFESSLTDSAKVGADGKVVDGSVTRETEGTHTYSVTVPPGTSLAEAAAINPFDPSTLPPGAEVTIENSLAAEVSAEAGITYRGIRAGAEGSASGEVSYVTTLARAEDGTLSVDQGPGTAIGVDGGIGIGVEDLAKVEAGGSAVSSTSVVQHARFTGDESGAQAAQDALLGGGMPETTGGPVLERYWDTRESAVANLEASASVGSSESGGSVGVEAEIGAVERITRTYPDGHEVWETRAVSWGKGEPAMAIERGETGQPPTYTLDLNTTAGSLHEQYPETLPTDPNSAPPETRIAYTEQEVRHMMEHNGVEGDPFEYLTARSQEGAAGAERMYYDYKHIDTAEQERRIEAGEVEAPPGYMPDTPGKVLEPHQTSDVVVGKGDTATAGAAGSTGSVGTTD